MKPQLRFNATANHNAVARDRPPVLKGLERRLVVASVQYFYQTISDQLFEKINIK
jgi:uncharacterized SAM-dependent methyltransferase